MQHFDDIDPTFFLYIGAFVGILLLVEALRQFLSDGKDAAKSQSRRMSDMSAGFASAQNITLVREAPSRSFLSKIPVYGTLPAKMKQAGLRLAPATFLGICAAGALGLFAVAAVVVGVPTAALMAALCSMVIPMSVINIIRKKRVAKFSEQLPDALELMMRGLRVGHPLNVTIQNVAANMPDPIGTEFAIMATQITYGDDLVQSFFDLADRIDQEDMHFLAVSVSIQHGTGGNLAAMLHTLAKVIRGRFAMRRRILAISSEGRITVWVLTSLPFLMYLTTTFTAPGYYSSVSDDPLYLPIACAIGFLVTMNFIVMRRLVNFRV